LSAVTFTSANSAEEKASRDCGTANEARWCRDVEGMEEQAVETHVEGWRTMNCLRQLHNIGQVEDETLRDLEESGQTGCDIRIMS
jgi:hypothetical protein